MKHCCVSSFTLEFANFTTLMFFFRFRKKESEAEKAMKVRQLSIELRIDTSRSWCIKSSAKNSDVYSIVYRGQR